MSFFGSNAGSAASSLEQLISELGEPIDARGLVQYVTEDRGVDLWALLLLTPTTLHVIYGEGRNWFARLTTQSPPEQHDLAIPLDTIAAVDLPERGGFLNRILTGPTRLAVVHRRDADPIRLEVDDPAAAVLEEVRSRIAAD